MTFDRRALRAVLCLVLQILVIAGIPVVLVGLVLWMMKLGFDWLEARARRNDKRIN
jgi:hypothetical protein